MKYISLIVTGLYWLTFVPIILVLSLVAVYLFDEIGWGMPWRWLVVANLTLFVGHLVLTMFAAKERV